MAPYADPNGWISGSSYVVFGKTDNTTAIELSDVAAGNGGFVIHGESEGDNSGRSVSSAGDINGDGLADLIIGANTPIPMEIDSGSSYVVFGKTDNTTAIQLSDIAAGSGGFVIHGESERDYSGYSVSSAGDVNGDGLADLIIGANGADPNGESIRQLLCRLWHNRHTTAIELSDIAAGSGGFVIHGESRKTTTAAPPSALLAMSTAMDLLI